MQTPTWTKLAYGKESIRIVRTLAQHPPHIKVTITTIFTNAGKDVCNTAVAMLSHPFISFVGFSDGTLRMCRSKLRFTSMLTFDEERVANRSSRSLTGFESSGDLLFRILSLRDPLGTLDISAAVHIQSESVCHLRTDITDLTK